MPKLMNQLVTTSLSQVSVSTGAVSGGGGGGGTTFDVAVRAEGQSTTNGYSYLSYSNVSATQYGTFTQGINTVATGSGGTSSTAATSTVKWEFDTDGVYYVEFNTYGVNSNDGFQFAEIHRGGITNVWDERIMFVGNQTAHNRKPSSVLRKFESGDVITFFAYRSAPDSASRILIAKVG